MMKYKNKKRIAKQTWLITGRRRIHKISLIRRPYNKTMVAYLG